MATNIGRRKSQGKQDDIPESWDSSPTTSPISESPNRTIGDNEDTTHRPGTAGARVARISELVELILLHLSSPHAPRHPSAASPTTTTSDTAAPTSPPPSTPHRDDSHHHHHHPPHPDPDAVLRLRTLLVSCQLVSPLWRALITTHSSALQERLFFRLPPPLLPLPPRPSGSSADPDSARAEAQLLRYRRRITNPLLAWAFYPALERGPEWGSSPGFVGSRDKEVEAVAARWTAGGMREGGRRSKAFRRKGASWRRMFVCRAVVGWGENDVAGSGAEREKGDGDDGRGGGGAARRWAWAPGQWAGGLLAPGRPRPQQQIRGARTPRQWWVDSVERRKKAQEEGLDLWDGERDKAVDDGDDEDNEDRGGLMVGYDASVQPRGQTTGMAMFRLPPVEGVQQGWQGIMMGDMWDLFYAAMFVDERPLRNTDSSAPAFPPSFSIELYTLPEGRMPLEYGNDSIDPLIEARGREVQLIRQAMGDDAACLDSSAITAAKVAIRRIDKELSKTLDPRSWLRVKVCKSWGHNLYELERAKPMPYHRAQWRKSAWRYCCEDFDEAVWMARGVVKKQPR